MPVKIETDKLKVCICVYIHLVYKNRVKIFLNGTSVSAAAHNKDFRAYNNEICLVYLFFNI